MDADTCLCVPHTSTPIHVRARIHTCEYCKGGELNTFSREKISFTEDRVRSSEWAGSPVTITLCLRTFKFWWIPMPGTSCVCFCCSIEKSIAKCEAMTVDLCVFVWELCSSSVLCSGFDLLYSGFSMKYSSFMPFGFLVILTPCKTGCFGPNWMTSTYLMKAIGNSWVNS